MEQRFRRKLAIFSVALLTATSLASASPLSDHDLDSTVIESGGYHAVDLGNVSAGNHVDISFVSYVEIDGLFMTIDQYYSWVSGGSEYIRDGSAIGQTIEMYTYTITANDHYWYVLDLDLSLLRLATLVILLVFLSS